MSDILDKIVATKKVEIAAISQRISLGNQREIALANNQNALLQPRGFINSINQKIAAGKAGVITEIKKASPSKASCAKTLIPQKLHAPMNSMVQRVYRF